MYQRSPLAEHTLYQRSLLAELTLYQRSVLAEHIQRTDVWFLAELVSQLVGVLSLVNQTGSYQGCFWQGILRLSAFGFWHIRSAV